MIKKYLLAGLVASVISLSAQAMTLQDAKSLGYIGELGNGYIALVKDSDDAKKLVIEVNKKRRAHFEKIAKKNNLTLEAVAQRAGKKFIEKTKAGYYIKDSSGHWLKK